jgi:hypothetical protein
MSDHIKEKVIGVAFSTYGERRDAYRVLVGKPEGKGLIEIPRHTWEYNINMDVQEVGWRHMGWIDLTQDRDTWRTLVNTVSSN